MDQAPHTPRTVLAAAAGMTTTVWRRPHASASTGQRRRWAVWQAVWVLLWGGGAATALAFAASGSSILNFLFWFAVCAASSVYAFRELRRTRLILRGRGRPSPGALQTENKRVVGVLLAFPCAFAGLALVLILSLPGMFRGTMERAEQSKLGAIRSAISIYYGDTEGEYPPDLETLTKDGRYLGEVPKVKVENGTLRGLHGRSAKVVFSATPTDAGGYLYDSRTGTIAIYCTHIDLRGKVWADY